MLGILYLLLACYVGWHLNKLAFSQIYRLEGMKSFCGTVTNVPSWMATAPFAFITGTMLITWLTYIVSYMARGTASPMVWGNSIVMVIFAVLCVYFFLKEKNKPALNNKAEKRKYTFELWFLVVAGAFCMFLMFYTFYVDNGVINVGRSVFSDFAPHLAMIRSFSYGSNFPTDYPHFPDGNLRYHFLFQFLSGNLEFLGMRIDYAFNIPSILSMLGLFMSIYTLSVVLTNKRAVGIIACILFSFRSSFAFFTFASGFKSLDELIAKLVTITTHIGKTQHEDWGLWNLNVYVNQRHFAFSLAMLFIVIILMIPNLLKMQEAINAIFQKRKDAEDKKKAEALLSEKKNKVNKGNKKAPVAPTAPEEPIIEEKQKSRFNEFLLTADAWLPEDRTKALALGVLIGLASFWNGAVVTAILGILLVMAIFSKNRLEYLVIALITLVLSTIQTNFFIQSGKSAVEFKFFFGFLANDKTPGGVLSYYNELLGIFPFMVIAAFLIQTKRICIGKGCISIESISPYFRSFPQMRWLTLCFLVPLIMATTISLTPDVTVNHKYVMMTVMLSNVIIAAVIWALFETRYFITRALAVIIILLMTITGLVDLRTVYNIDVAQNNMKIQYNDPLTVWAAKNTAPKDIFLSPMYSLHPLFLSGRASFLGWPYYAWSAGYDTYGRGKIVADIYGAKDIDTVKSLCNKYGIKYIIIENGNRNNKDYKLNEGLFKSNLKRVYSQASENMDIYKVE